MSTITNPSIIKEMLQSAGRFEGDPPAKKIYVYTNIYGKEAYAVFWKVLDDDMASSPFVGEFALLFSNGEVTEMGEAWLKKQQEKEE